MLEMVGQILIGLFFVFMGVYNLKNREQFLESLKHHNFKIPEYVLIALVALELLSGVLVVFNYATKFGSLYLIAFTALVSFLLHPFWSLKGKDMWKQLMIVATNVALIGGLLIILSVHI